MIQSNFPVGDSTATKNHINNGDIHVTAAQKTAWNNKPTGVKGDAESNYRTGNVNITPADIGSYSKAEVDARINTNVVDHTIYLSSLFSVSGHKVTFNPN